MANDEIRVFNSNAEMLAFVRGKGLKIEPKKAEKKTEKKADKGEKKKTASKKASK